MKMREVHAATPAYPTTKGYTDTLGFAGGRE
jgi:hypothetical protein